MLYGSVIFVNANKDFIIYLENAKNAQPDQIGMEKVVLDVDLTLIGLQENVFAIQDILI
jgi:hypothetical protein